MKTTRPVSRGEFGFFCRHAQSQLLNVKTGPARLSKHVAGLFLFFRHVVFDHFRQHLDFGVVKFIVLVSHFDFSDQHLRAVMFDVGFVYQGVFERPPTRWIEDVLFYFGVDANSKQTWSATAF